MPLKNQFHHQQYYAEEPSAPWRLHKAPYPAQPGSESFTASLSRFSAAIEPEVDAIWFVHGTFAGNDALGWFGQLERLVPATGPVLKQFGKKLTDLLAGDSGNYSPDFMALLDLPRPARRFVWSGENTHSGRSKAAIELLDELLQRLPNEKRVQLWGHSHAGNVAALISNLIGSDAWVVDKFLDLAAPLFPVVDDRSGALSRVREAHRSGRLRELQMDAVNFGTPICYGWDTAGYRKLLHVINHVPQVGQSDWVCSPIEAGKSIRSGVQGDLVQVLAIAGSDFLPWLLSRSSRDCEAGLHEFLAADFSRRDWWSRAKLGMRVAAEGQSLLVEYDNFENHARETLGHSVYTRPQWLSFHLDLVAELYR